MSKIREKHSRSTVFFISGHSGVRYPASRVSFDLPDFSRKIEGGSARRVGVLVNTRSGHDKRGEIWMSLIT